MRRKANFEASASGPPARSKLGRQHSARVEAQTDASAGLKNELRSAAASLLTTRRNEAAVKRG